MLLAPVTVMLASPFCSTGVPSGPIKLHVSVAFDRSKALPSTSSSVPALAQSAAARGWPSRWRPSVRYLRDAREPLPHSGIIVGAGRTSTPTLVVFRPGAFVELQPHARAVDAEMRFDALSQHRQGQRRGTDGRR